MIASGSASECASARSRLSATGSHSEATAAWVSATARLAWAAHRLRKLSRSARARSRWSSASATLDRRSASSAPTLARSLDASGARSSRASPAPGSLIGSEFRVDHVIGPAPRLGCLLILWRRLRGPGRAQQALVDLLQFQRQAPQSVDRSVLAESLPGVGRQGLRAGLLVHGERLSALVEQVLDGICS